MAKQKKEEVDPRDTTEWLYKPVTIDESKGYKDGRPQYKKPHVDIIDRKVEQFVEKGIKFIRHSTEVDGVKHDIVMTVEAFNKLSATNKKLFMGGK